MEPVAEVRGPKSDADFGRAAPAFRVGKPDEIRVGFRVGHGLRTDATVIPMRGSLW